jgi:histone deacetylase complex regulatory component SIN3
MRKIKSQISVLLTERSDGYLERCRLDLNVDRHQAKSWSKKYDKAINFQWRRAKLPIASAANSSHDDVSAEVSEHLANNLSLIKFFKLTNAYSQLLSNPLDNHYIY